MNTWQSLLFLAAFALWVGLWVYITEKYIRPWCCVATEKLIDKLCGV